MPDVVEAMPDGPAKETMRDGLRELAELRDAPDDQA